MAKFWLENGEVKSYDQLVMEWKKGLLRPPNETDDESNESEQPLDTILNTERDDSA